MLTETIRRVHAESRGTYGNRRVRAELDRGHSMGHHQVEPLINRAGLAGATGRPRFKRGRPDTVSADLVDRKIIREGPNQLWVTDIAEHYAMEGKINCAGVLDVFSRRVVVCSIKS